MTVDLTPTVARDWLSSNGVNRKIRRHIVTKYAKDMITGAWRDEDAEYTRRRDGLLLDGQHRCLAVIDSGVTVRARVHIIDDSVKPMDVRLDTGLTRIAADFGIDQKHAAIARALHRIATSSPVGLSVDGVKETIRVISPELGRITMTTTIGVTTAGMRSAVCAAMWRYPDVSDEIAAQYNALANKHLDYRLWPGLASAVRQISEVRGGGWERTKEDFIRISRALHPDGRRVTRINVRNWEKAQAEATAMCRAYLRISE